MHKAAGSANLLRHETVWPTYDCASVSRLAFGKTVVPDKAYAKISTRKSTIIVQNNVTTMHPGSEIEINNNNDF